MDAIRSVRPGHGFQWQRLSLLCAISRVRRRALWARQTSSGTVSWYLADRLGTDRDLINNSGSIIDHVDFSAFGTVLGETSPANGDRFMGFASLARDSVTGMNLAVERVENPETGRWGSQDPLGFAAGDANLYIFVNNNDISLTDPSGLQSGDDEDPPKNDPTKKAAPPKDGNPVKDRPPGGDMRGPLTGPKHDKPDRRPNPNIGPRQRQRQRFEPPPPVDPSQYPGFYIHVPSGNEQRHDHILLYIRNPVLLLLVRRLARSRQTPSGQASLRADAQSAEAETVIAAAQQVIQRLLVISTLAHVTFIGRH